MKPGTEPGTEGMLRNESLRKKREKAEGMEKGSFAAQASVWGTYPVLERLSFPSSEVGPTVLTHRAEERMS